MSEGFLCARQESCPVVLAACERNVMAESEARIAKAKADDYEAKRAVMNRLFSAGVNMRKAQREYFRNRTTHNISVAKDLEQRFDDALRAFQALMKPSQPTLLFTP